MKCPYCQAPAEIRDSAIVYNGRSYGPIWLCSNYPRCDAYVGTHPGTEKPLGRLANPELREWKKRAHSMFDPIWKNGSMKRPQAYKWLSDKMGIPRDECHIGMFDIDQCREVVELCSIHREMDIYRNFKLEVGGVRS